MQTILPAVLAFVLAHPTECVASIGALLAFVLSKLQPLILASPRMAALYAVLVRLFPNLTDPKALAADIWTIVVGKPGDKPSRGGPLLPPGGPALALVLAGIGGAAVTLDGCAWLKSHEPAIVHSVDTGCEVVTMLTVDATAQAICLTLEDIGKLIDELLAAQVEGRAAVVRLVGADGTTREIRVDVAHLAEALDAAKASHAKLKAKMGGAK